MLTSKPADDLLHLNVSIRLQLMFRRERDYAMRMIRTLVVLTRMLTLSAYGTNSTAGNYSGSDAGYLVVGLAAHDTMESRAIKYTLDYRRLESSDIGSVSFSPKKKLELMPFLNQKTDFEDGNEMGVVEVRRLPPGKYELFKVEGALYGGFIQWRWQSKNSFSIPFTIEAGNATYVGHFQGHSTSVRSVVSLGAPLPSGAYFIVSNQNDHDLQIARKKVGAFQEVKTAVPDVAELKSEYFLRECPSKECE